MSASEPTETAVAVEPQAVAITGQLQTVARNIADALVSQGLLNVRDGQRGFTTATEAIRARLRNELQWGVVLRVIHSAVITSAEYEADPCSIAGPINHMRQQLESMGFNTRAYMEGHYPGVSRDTAYGDQSLEGGVWMPYSGGTASRYVLKSPDEDRLEIITHIRGALWSHYTVYLGERIGTVSGPMRLVYPEIGGLIEYIQRQFEGYYISDTYDSEIPRTQYGYVAAWGDEGWSEGDEDDEDDEDDQDDDFEEEDES